MLRRNYSIWLLFLGASIVIFAAISPTQAQSDNDVWTPPWILAEFPTEGDALIGATTDFNGDLHVVWRFQEGNSNEIFYSRKSGENWVEPINILISPDEKPIRSLRIIADETGMLHVVWVGENGYYSSAKIDEAGTAWGWQPAKKLYTGLLEDIDIIAGNLETIHVIYTILPGDVYSIRSHDSGQHWSDPVNVSRVASDQQAIKWNRLAIGEDGILHAVWTNVALPDAWPPLGVYYARSFDDGDKWESQLIASGGYDQIGVVTGQEGIVYVAYNGMAGSLDLPSIGGRHFQWSEDNGDTWNGPIEISSSGFTGGIPNLVVDSNNELHVLISILRPFYTKWNGFVFDTVDSVMKPIDENILGNTEYPVMVIGNGNQLHLLVRDRNGRIWYQSKKINAPALLPTQILPTTPTPTPTTFSSEMPIVVEDDATLQSDFSEMGSEHKSNPMQPIFVGLLPVLILLFSAAIIYKIRQ